MKTQIKTLTLCAATLAAATVAGAYNRPGQERPNRKPAGFKCPVCESPCINKAALQRQVRQHRLQNQDGPRLQRNAHPRWQGGQERTSQRPQQQARRKQTGRFDIDGDGQLSHAEKAARRAYRDAMDRNQGVQGNARPDPQPPVE